MGTIAVIGLGNILLQDEGVGIHALRYLEEHYLLPSEVELVDGGTMGLDLLPYLEGREKVLLLDAVDFGREPGYIGLLTQGEIPAFLGQKDSLHHLGLADVLAVAHLSGSLPEALYLLGIQPAVIATGLELSPLLQTRLPQLVAEIVRLLQSWPACLPPPKACLKLQ